MENKRFFIKGIAILNILTILLTSLLPVFILLKPVLSEAENNKNIQNIKETLVNVCNDSNLENYDVYVDNEIISKNEIERIGLNAYKVDEGIEFYLIPKVKNVKEYKVSYYCENGTKKEFYNDIDNLEPVIIKLSGASTTTLYIEEKKNDNEYQIIETKEFEIRKNKIVVNNNIQNASIIDGVLYVRPNETINLITEWEENGKSNLVAEEIFTVINKSKNDSWKIENNKLKSPEDTNNTGLLEWKNKNGATTEIKVKTSNFTGNGYEIISKKVEKYSRFYTFDEKDYLAEIDIGAEINENTPIQMKLNSYSNTNNIKLDKDDIKLEDCNNCLNSYSLNAENSSYLITINAKKEGIIKIIYTDWDGNETYKYWHIYIYDNKMYTNITSKTNLTNRKAIFKD